MSVTSKPFGADGDGHPVDLYILDNGVIELHAITFGGVITSLRVPDRAGNRGDVVLGHETLEPYLTNPPYLGAVVGRYANRIARGHFALDGEAYRLATNNGQNHLHGGPRGFHRQLWEAQPMTKGDTFGVTFNRVSPAGEEGYPGQPARVGVVPVVRPRVDVHYEATTDTPTVLNLSQHSYFNLAGQSSANILGHELTVRADAYTPGRQHVDSDWSARIPCKGRRSTCDRARWSANDCSSRTSSCGWPTESITTSSWPERPVRCGPPRYCAIRRVDDGWRCRRRSRACQVYTGQSLDGRITGAYGRRFTPHTGMCLETQHFPDSPNHPQFPTTVVRPGQRWTSTTRWRFGL